MKTTIDAAGRLVIPREARRAAGLEPGMSLDIHVEDGKVVIEPAPTPIRKSREGRFVVARPSRPVPVLSGADVEDTRARLQAERGVARGKKGR